MFRVWPILLCLALLAVPVNGFAVTRYVTDQLLISLRSNADPDASLITTLKTDTPLEVLDDQGEFLRVRTPGGEEGYVLSRYVTSAIPKPRQIKRLRDERDALQERVERLEKDLKEEKGASEEPLQALQDQAATLKARLEEKSRQLAAVKEDYTSLQKDAGDVVAIVNDRDRLQTRNEQLKQQLDTLREQNSTLLRTALIRWFLAGAGVLLFGWVLGRLSRRKRRSF